ncbi:hypothetical protein pEaSNUABM37_00147 [Erwinia phage pEa_SNUABM_37]|nr:hypothetical protein pEaSNUABM37_00147 [Erwinia phage pEa_SNUABM_37]QXO10617.1 hypothetical protein pEaSNUABM48_00147 [Erwinia phage pEa_SNUABM_48]
MHDLIVVLCAIVGFIALIWVTSVAFDNVEERANEKRFRILNEFLEKGEHTLDYTTIALITAELRYRMSMTGEYEVTVEHRALLSAIARNVYILVKAGVRDQMQLLSVVCEQLNRRGHHKARMNITTNNRVELIIQFGTEERLTYIKLHSVNTLF